MERINDDVKRETREDGAEEAYRMNSKSAKVLPLRRIVDMAVNHTGVNEIDFIDIDVEGAELFILEKFDFSKVPIHVLSIDMEDEKTQEKIHEILSRAGYVGISPPLVGASKDKFYWRECGPWERQLPPTHPKCIGK